MRKKTKWLWILTTSAAVLVAGVILNLAAPHILTSNGACRTSCACARREGPLVIAEPTAAAIWFKKWEGFHP